MKITNIFDQLLIALSLLVVIVALFSPTKTILAQTPTTPPCTPSCSRSGSYFCRDDTIMERQNASCGASCGDITIEDCSTKVDGDWRCVDGKRECYKYYQAQMTINPTTPALGNAEVGVRVLTTYSCYNGSYINSNFRLDLGPALRSVSNLDESCIVTFQNCRQTPELRCLWTGTCVAKELTSSFNATFTSEKGPLNPYGVEYYPLRITDGDYCNAILNYSVVPSETCQADEADARDNVIDPTFALNPALAYLLKRDQIVAPSLRDDRLMAKAQSQALLPPSINEAINSQISLKDQNGDLVLPLVGVQTGFFNTIIGKILCSIPILRTFYYCPDPINLAVDQTLFTSTNQTDLLVNQSAVLSQTERPIQITPTPVKPSCYLKDIELQGGDSTQGNLKLDKIDTQMGQSVYGDGLPKYTDYTTNPLEIQKIGIDPTSNNISIHSKVFYGDQRPLQVNLNQKLYDQAVYPTGFMPFNDSNFGGGSCPPGQTQC